MGAASILLAVVSFLCVGLGFVLTPVPVVGTLFSFAAPTLALAGIVVGGVGRSRASRAGRSTDTATAGIVLGVFALIPALLVALTCGMCNAACSTGEVHTQRSFDVHFGQGGGPGQVDAGPPRPTTPATPPPRDAGAAPPPAFPPPPMEAR